MLSFNPVWRFESPGPASDEVAEAFWALLEKVLAQSRDQAAVENFKRWFAPAAGRPYDTSSNRGWALSDLKTLFFSAAGSNEPLFIEALYAGLQGISAGPSGVGVPSVDYLNGLLARHNAGFRIDPPNLVAANTYRPIQMAPVPPSLEQQARLLIERSLDQSQQLLDEGRFRQAVQEILWLLETVVTAFKGLDIDSTTIQGKYFNVIAKEVRAQPTGSLLQQTMGWIMTLHGYLSSPTGGAVRHGRDLKEGQDVSPSGARLYCNLARSYIAYLLEEHERIAAS